MMFPKLALTFLLLWSGHAVEDELETKGTNLRGSADADVEVNPGRELQASTDMLDIEQGIWGGWGPIKTAKPGWYACGAQIRYENPGGDDTAANGLKLKFCSYDDWNLNSGYNFELVEEGFWGEWKDPVSCPYGRYINGAKTRFEPNQGGGDDTALNGLYIHCVSKTGDAGWVLVWGGDWGNWNTGKIAPTGWFVSGAMMRIEPKQGGGDDTAWNGLKFEITKAQTKVNGKITKEKPKGSWEKIGSGSGAFEREVAIGIEKTDGSEVTKEDAASISVAVMAGFESPVGPKAEVTVTGEVSTSVAESMSKSLTTKKDITVKATCTPPSNAVGYLWQWVMTAKADSYGPGYEIESNDYLCMDSSMEPGKALKPRCPPEYCSDAKCQECLSVLYTA